MRAINRLFKMAVVGGIEAAVRLHINRGDDLEGRDERGFTLLMLAAARDKASVCRLLIEAGANWRALDPSGKDALAIAWAAGASRAALVIESIRELEPAIQIRFQTSEDQRAETTYLNEALCERVMSGGVDGDGPKDDPRTDHTNLLMETRAEFCEQHPAQQDPVALSPPSIFAEPPDRALFMPKGIGDFFIDEEDAPTLDPSRWEVDVTRPPPIDDPSLVGAQAETQGIITKHTPIDDSEDWQHFDAFLPQEAAPLVRVGDAESKRELRKVLLRALREGSVPDIDVEQLCTDDEGIVEQASLASLRLIINDLGAETDERFEQGSPFRDYQIFVADEETESEEEIVDGAIAFLNDLEGQRNDPMRLYMKDALRERLLTAEEEITLAKAMEDATQRAVGALATWPSGIDRVLVAIAKARVGERQVNAITSWSSEDAEPESSELVNDLDLDTAVSIKEVSATIDEDLGVDPLVEATVVEVPELQASAFFDKADQLSALRASQSQREAFAAHAILVALSLKRTFLMELADGASDDKSEPSTRFVTAVRSLATSRTRMAVANLRLVLSTAKRYLYSGLPVDDLVQEGNIGLLKAVDKFDWRRGYKFSTMALWWIKQNVARSIGDQGRTIRLPIHLYEKLQRVEREAKEMARSQGREPSIAEVATRMSMAPAKVEALLRAGAPPLSLHLTDTEGDLVYGNIEDLRPDPFDAVAAAELRSLLESCLAELDEKLSRVLRMRFGVALDEASTLEEVGAHLQVTRERVRQIEAKALGRLGNRRHRELFRGWIREEEGNRESIEVVREAKSHGVLPRSKSISKTQTDARPRAPTPRSKSTRSQGHSAIDRVLARAAALGISVEDERSKERRLTCVKVNKAVDAPTRALIRVLISMGFKYSPGKGYLR